MEINAHVHFMKWAVDRHVLPCHDIQESDKYICMFFPRMDMDLAKWLKIYRASASDAIKLDMMQQIVKGCLDMKSRDFFHRDLKPGNILVSLTDSLGSLGSLIDWVLTEPKPPIVRVADLGLAAKGYNDVHKTYCGTPNYLSPEMTRKQEYTFAVDIWALGCIFFGFYSEKTPFECSNAEDLFMRIRTERNIQYPSSMPVYLQSLIESMLEKDYTKRPSLDTILFSLSL